MRKIILLKPKKKNDNFMEIQDKNNLPFVSVVIPSKNEDKFIGLCLDSFINNDYPKDRLEILIVNGQSTDNTKKIAEIYVKKYPYFRVLENPRQITPAGLNVGIKASKGKIVIVASGHATYEKSYISKCVKYSIEHKADNVGGVTKNIPAKNTYIAKAIALSLSSVFGAGNSHFRTGVKDFKWVDAVFGCCYRREIFDKIGFYNEKFIRSQDMEFNLRLKKSGGKILLAPDIITYYYPSSSLKDFWKKNFGDGVWATYPIKLTKTRLKLRHYIPFFFVFSLIATGVLGIFFELFYWLFLLILFSYVAVNFYFSAQIAFREKNIKFMFLMPAVFSTRHVAYGLGSIVGFLKK